jgi:hypothetical protein
MVKVYHSNKRHTHFGCVEFVGEGVGVIVGVCPAMTPRGKKRFPVAGRGEWV